MKMNRMIFIHYNWTLTFNINMHKYAEKFAIMKDMHIWPIFILFSFFITQYYVHSTRVGLQFAQLFVQLGYMNAHQNFLTPLAFFLFQMPFNV
jgi:hypothetical protein